MHKIISRPHLLFWLCIPLLILAGFIFRNDSFRINIFDTYYIFEKFISFIFLAVVFAILGAGYWLVQKMNRQLSVPLNVVHFLATIGGILLIVMLSMLFRNSAVHHIYNSQLTLAIYMLAILVILCQIIYPVNIILAFKGKPAKRKRGRRKKKRKSHS